MFPTTLFRRRVLLMTEKTSRQVTGNVEKTITMADSCVDRCWEMWHLSMGSLTEANEQLEPISKSCLDHRKKAISEGSRLIEQIINKFQNDTQSMLNMIKETIKYTIDNIDNTDHSVANHWADIILESQVSPAKDADVA
jgi:polyhydroxyalkanoate synthesis regulator phasin